MTTAPTPLHQECTDFATLLRSAFNVATTTRGSAPKSFLRAADLLESATATLRRLQAENERLRAELEARKPLHWEPQFDVMAPGQEELAIQFCAEIAGPRGKPGRNPDPVRLLEMAQALYKAEADAHMVDRSPNLQEPPVDKAANLQEQPTCNPLPPTEAEANAIWAACLRKHKRPGPFELIQEFCAAGPLPGITGGSS